jgi:hypothetical protein
MIFWLLYFSVDGQFTIEHPYHFAEKENCIKVGKEMVQLLKYEACRCVKEVRE